MLDFFLLLTELLLWFSGPLIFILIFRYYKQESMVYRITVATVLTTLSTVVFYFVWAYLMAASMLKNNPF